MFISSKVYLPTRYTSCSHAPSFLTTYIHFHLYSPHHSHNHAQKKSDNNPRIRIVKSDTSKKVNKKKKENPEENYINESKAFLCLLPHHSIHPCWLNRFLMKLLHSTHRCKNAHLFEPHSLRLTSTHILPRHHLPHHWQVNPPPRVLRTRQAPRISKRVFLGQLPLLALALP